MQYEPNAEDLLVAIAELLEDEVLPAVPDALKHKCRVAANLVRILEREERLGPAAAAREREWLLALLGGAGDESGVELSAALARRVRDDDPAFQQAAWETLVAIARADLVIARPGHDAWEGD
jgi:hypothetical protein